MNDKEKLKELEKAIIYGCGELSKISPNSNIMTTCPFCFAKLIGTDVPKKCPHCDTLFKDDDDLQLIEKKSWLDKALKPEVRL